MLSSNPEELDRYFGFQETTPQPESDFQVSSLCACPRENCNSDFVQLINGEQCSEDKIWLQRSCPDCGWLGSGLFSAEEVDLYEECLEAGAEQLKNSRGWLGFQVMKEEAAVFVGALRQGQILPEDF